VRMLGKLLDACIWLDDNLMTTHFKLAEHAQLIIFCTVAWKKWVHENVSFRSVYNGQLRLCMSLLCGLAEAHSTVEFHLKPWASKGMDSQLSYPRHVNTKYH
jgi:hypothetical protein